jgi:hypothetical protein
MPFCIKKIYSKANDKRMLWRYPQILREMNNIDEDLRALLKN